MSTFPGKYLEGGKEAGGQLVDQRLLPRISEGEVRVLMAGDTCQMIIHKKPEGGKNPPRPAWESRVVAAGGTLDGWLNELLHHWARLCPPLILPRLVCTV